MARRSYEHRMTMINCRHLVSAHEQQEARRLRRKTSTMWIEGLSLGACLLVIMLLIELLRVFRVS